MLQQNASHLMRLKTRRKLWLEVHLWLGLVAGAVLVLIGLTGSILVFWQEIDAWLHPSLLRIESPHPAKARPMTALGEAARAALPAGVKPVWIEFPRHENEALALSYEVPSASVPGQTDTTGPYISTRILDR